MVCDVSTYRLLRSLSSFTSERESQTTKRESERESQTTKEREEEGNRKTHVLARTGLETQTRGRHRQDARHRQEDHARVRVARARERLGTGREGGTRVGRSGEN